MFQKFNRIACAAILAALLAGCASSVKLDPAPVEDKSPAPAVSAGSTSPMANASPVAQPSPSTGRTVSPVELSKPSDAAAGPTGGRIVYFDYDSYVVKPEFQSVLDAQSQYLKSDRNRKASIEGHTDERGGREYNLALGQKRAEAVRRALVLLGVSDAQLDAVSFGKEKPADSGSGEAAWAKNRRAEFSYRP